MDRCNSLGHNSGWLSITRIPLPSGVPAFGLDGLLPVPAGCVSADLSPQPKGRPSFEPLRTKSVTYVFSINRNP